MSVFFIFLIKIFMVNISNTISLNKQHLAIHSFQLIGNSTHKFTSALKINFYHVNLKSGQEKLGFLVNETPCSSKQVQGYFVSLVILCSYWRYEVQVFASPGTSLCTNCNRSRLQKEQCLNEFRCSCIQCFFLILTV